MKKIWYLSNADKKDKRVAGLFVYENNGRQKAQLDLMSFSDKPGFSKVEIFFYVPQKATIEALSCQPEDCLIKYALKGKGVLSEECAQHITESVRDLQLRIIWGGKVYDSFSCTEELPPSVTPKETAETTKKDEQRSEETDTEMPRDLEQAKAGEKSEKQDKEPPEILAEAWLDEESEESENVQDCETKNSTVAAQKEDIRRVVKLAVLEEEMIFRSFVHNSFLLHGYYNYGHLVIDEKEGRLRLGVPGNFYEREKAVAAMFGFSDFEPSKSETVVNGTFGYYFTAYT